MNKSNVKQNVETSLQLDRDKLVEAALVEDVPSRKEALLMLSQGGVLLQVIGLVARNAKFVERQIISTSVATDEGRLRQIEMQGALRGMDSVIDMIIDLTQESGNG